MKFAIFKTRYYYQGDRVVIGIKDTEPRATTYLCQVIIKTTNDFDINEDFIFINSEMDSVQYRPKSLHQSNKGVFYQGSDKKRVYLNDKQVEAMNKFIEWVKEEIKIK